MAFDADLFFVLGIVIGVLAIPALLSAFSESRFPRAALVLSVIAASLIVFAVSQKPPGSYSIADTPEIFMKVIGKIVN